MINYTSIQVIYVFKTQTYIQVVFKKVDENENYEKIVQGFNIFFAPK